ncbi:MAG TPA: cation:proton antiporter [Candidatus Nitrosocosmicus sp.]|nr:cation:proton antiporter [Candidatus Nitrosocosmicus sp.]
MSDVSASSLFNVFIFLLIPFIAAYTAKLLRFPPLVGYILGGLSLATLIGNSAMEIINGVAFFGIVFLLFTIGLEVNFNQLLRLKKFILIGGTLQILFTGIFVYILSFVFQFSVLSSLLIALAFTSSSTILVAKIIQEKGEEGSFVGQLALGILMLQDLAFIPLLIIFESLHTKDLSISDIFFDIAFSIIKAGVIITIMFFVGKKLIPKLFNQIARESRELLNLFIILFIVGVTYLSILLHIPVLIGVFIAGILVGQTYEHHHIFSQIRPFRDMLAVVFFVFIGININIVAVLPFIPKIILFSLLVVVIKVCIIFFICIKMRLHTRTAFSISMLLFQVSENAFILMYSAVNNKIIPYTDYLFVVTSVLFTLILTPILIKNKDTIYIFLRALVKRHLPLIENYLNKRIDSNISPIDELSLRGHVVICGYGRIGNQIGRALNMAQIPFIAIDYNFDTVEKNKAQGVNIIYGDPTDISILDYAQVDEAKVLISALPEQFAQETIILNAQKLNPKITIISRVHQHRDAQRLLDLGVDIVVQPEFEASISIIKKLLHTFKSSKDEIVGHVKRIKIEEGMV